MKAIKAVTQEQGEVVLRIEGLQQFSTDESLFRLTGVSIKPLNLPYPAMHEALELAGWEPADAEREIELFVLKLERKQLANILAERTQLG